MLEKADAKNLLAYQYSGFSVDAGVCIYAHDRAALERLLRYCARPPFAMKRLRKEDRALVYRCAKQHTEPTNEVRPLLCPQCGGQMRLIVFQSSRARRSGRYCSA